MDQTTGSDDRDVLGARELARARIGETAAYLAFIDSVMHAGLTCARIGVYVLLLVWVDRHPVPSGLLHGVVLGDLAARAVETALPSRARHGAERAVDALLFGGAAIYLLAQRGVPCADVVQRALAGLGFLGSLAVHLAPWAWRRAHPS